MLYLFEKRTEMFNLLWPLVPFSVFALLFLTYGTPPKSIANILLFISGAVFLNVVHNVFTIFIIAFFPEARAWLNSYSKGKRYRLFLKWTLLFAGLVFFFYEARDLLAVDSDFDPPKATIAFAFITGYVANLHHTIMQIRGLSTAYNKVLEQQRKLSESEITLLRKGERFERHLFTAFLATSALALWFNLNQQATFRIPLFALSILIFAGIIVNSLYLPYARQSTKTFYLGRLIFYPIGVIYPQFLICVPFFHGVEYLFVFQKMWRRSEVSKIRTYMFIFNVLVPLALLTALISAARSYRGFGNYLSAVFSSHQELIIWIGVVSLALNYLHFYLDREIFRMKDPIVRKHLGPLIV